MTLREYIEITELQSSSIIDFNVGIIAIVEEIPNEEILEWKFKNIVKRAKDIHDIYKRVNKSSVFALNNTIQTDAGELHYKSIFEMTLSEYMDLEYFLSQGDVGKVIALVYRKKVVSKYDADKWEDYDDYLTKRLTIFESMDIGLLIGAYHRIIEDKKLFLEQFKGVFVKDDFNYEEAKQKAKDENERRVLEEEEQKDKVSRSFNFEFMMLSYADNDFTKLETIANMNVVILFKFILTRKTLEKLRNDG